MDRRATPLPDPASPRAREQTDFAAGAESASPDAPPAQPICLRRGEIGAASALVAVGCFFIWHALRLDLGHVGLPGPGFFPLALAIALTAFAGWIAWRSWRERASGEAVALGHRDVLIATAAMLCVPFAFGRLGAYATLGVFAVALLVFIGRVPIVRAALAAIAGMTACWYFFQVLLGLQLPRGPF